MLWTALQDSLCHASASAAPPLPFWTLASSHLRALLLFVALVLLRMPHLTHYLRRACTAPRHLLHSAPLAPYGCGCCVLCRDWVPRLRDLRVSLHCCLTACAFCHYFLRNCASALHLSALRAPAFLLPSIGKVGGSELPLFSSGTCSAHALHAGLTAPPPALTCLTCLHTLTIPTTDLHTASRYRCLHLLLGPLRWNLLSCIFRYGVHASGD